MFQSCWADYEESHSVFIWEQNGNLFVREKGYKVFIGSYDTKRRITQDEALEIMLEEIENEDQDYLNFWCGE